MGSRLSGFGGGRVDIWEPEEDVYWGTEDTWLGDKRYSGDRDLENPLAAVQMGLIYVNPEGPNGNPDPVASGKDVRVTFARMGMNDEETVALVAGGHTFGKCHGAGDAKLVGPEPEAAPIEEQGLGWKSSYKSGKAGDTISSGIEGAWKPNPTKWDMGYLKVLFKYEWELVKSPAGAHQWLAKNVAEEDMVVDARNPSKKLRPMMTTADLSLRYDPVYRTDREALSGEPGAVCGRVREGMVQAYTPGHGASFAVSRPEVPSEELIWQDPIPAVNHQLVDGKDITVLKKRYWRPAAVSELVATAWASASTFRGSDKRGGANGARIRLAPQKDWEVNQPARLKKVLGVLEGIQAEFSKSQSGGKSFARRSYRTRRMRGSGESGEECGC